MIKCQMCKKKMNPNKEPGAILLSTPFEAKNPPPVGDLYRKFHICKKCYCKLIRWIVTR